MVSFGAHASPKAEAHDCTALGSVEPGPAPTLSILEVDYGAFSYPRTLPLKASATDTDLIRVKCAACDGSEAEVPLADDVHPGNHERSGYRWVLTSGEGSLNKPYDLRALEQAEDTLDQAKNALDQHRLASREAEELAEAAQTVVSAIESRRAKAASKLEAADEVLRSLTLRLERLDARERVLETLLAGPDARLQVLRRDASQAQTLSLADALGKVHDDAEAQATFSKHATKQAGIDAQIGRLLSRLALLEAQLPRSVNLERIASMEAQREQLMPQLTSRHALTCRFATEVVPLLLTLRSADGAADGLAEAHESVRAFLELCDASQKPDYETLVRDLPQIALTCEHMAHGHPAPSPAQLEILPFCGALYRERQVLASLSEVHRRIDEAINAGGIESPRREMKAIRAKLRTLHDERRATREAWARAQRARTDALMAGPLVSDEVRRGRDAVDTEIADLASAVASTRHRLRTLRDEAGRVRAERAEADAHRRDAEAQLRAAQADLSVAWKEAQDAVEAARALSGEIATAEGRIKDAKQLIASKLMAIEVKREASAQVAWYSPPPLAVLLASAPEARRELEAARETRRKAAAELAQLEAEFTAAQDDQLARFERIISDVGAFKGKLVRQRQLELRRRALTAEIQSEVAEVVKEAEEARESLRLTRDAIDGLETEAAFLALVPRYQALRSERSARVSALAASENAVGPVFDAYLEQLGRVQRVRGEIVDKLVELKLTLASSLQFRGKVLESERAIAFQKTFDALLIDLEAEGAKRFASPDDRGHRSAIAERIDTLQAAIRKEEQSAEDTKALAGAQLRELSALNETLERSRRALDEARDAYHEARRAWSASRAALDDHDAQIVATRETIALRWTTMRQAAMALWARVGADHRGAAEEHTQVISALLRDLRLEHAEEAERFRVALVAKPHAFSGVDLVVSVDAVKTLDPLVAAARDRLADLEKIATDRRSVAERLPGSRLAALHRERPPLVAELIENTRARSASAAELDRDLREAKRLRERVSSSVLAETRARARASAEEYDARREKITRQLVSSLSVTFSLQATDRGASAGRADDPPVKTSVRLTFRDGKRPAVSAPPAARRDGSPKTTSKGTCKALITPSALKRHEWVDVPTLPKVVQAGEAMGVFATMRDLDGVTPACDAREPGCRRGARPKALTVEEFHPLSWSVENAPGFGGGAGHLVGGQTTASGIFVSPASAELMRDDTPVCEKSVVVSATALATGDLAKESAPKPKLARVLVKAGTIRAPEAPITALAGQPVDVTFEIYKLAEDGVPLDSNVAFEEPLDGQKVSLRVERVAGAEAGDAWGFDASKRSVTTLSRQGVVRETLTLSKTPGRYRVYADWREGQACQASLEVITPMNLSSRLLYAPKETAWTDAILGLIERGEVSEAALTETLQSLVKASERVDLSDGVESAEKMSRANFSGSLQSWTIVSDSDHRPVSGQPLLLSTASKRDLLHSEEASTGVNTLNISSGTFGLVRVQLSGQEGASATYPSGADTPEVRVERADVDAASYQLAPYPVRRAWGQEARLQEGWIGPHGLAFASSERFHLKLSRSATPGRPYSGKATLIAPIARGHASSALVTVPDVHLNAVIFDGEGVAREGSLTFDAPLEASCSEWAGGGKLCVRHLSVRAGHDASWKGVVTLPLSGPRGEENSTGPLRFSGTWTPGDGAIFNLLDDLPQLSLQEKGASRLERGAVATLDMSYRASAPGMAATWRGLSTHRGRVVLSHLRGAGPEGQASPTAPLLELGRVAWQWPFNAGITLGGVDAYGLTLGIPHVAGAAISRARVDLVRGHLSLDEVHAEWTLPGTQDPLNARFSEEAGAWSAVLSSAAPLRLGEWATIALMPGAEGRFEGGRLSQLIANLELALPGTSPLVMRGTTHAPSSAQLTLKSEPLSAAGHFAGRYPISFSGAELLMSPPESTEALIERRSKVSAEFALPSAPQGPGALRVNSGSGGIDLSAKVDASPHFGGVQWRGELTYLRGGLEGTLKAEEPARLGLDRAAAPPMRVVVEHVSASTPHLSMRGLGVIRPPEGKEASRDAFFNTPYAVHGGALGMGWHHSAPDRDFIGYRRLDPGAPLSIQGVLSLKDPGGGATVAAEVTMDYLHGQDPVALLEGEWTYFNRPGAMFGQGKARVHASGEMSGRVQLALDLDGPTGALVHAATPVDFVASKERVSLSSPRFEGFIQEAHQHFQGHLSAELQPSQKSAELVLKGEVAGRGTWEWPDDDPIAVMQVDLKTQLELPFAFKGDAEGGEITLSPTKTRWSAFVSGPIDLGFTRSLIEPTHAEGDGLACFPKGCIKAEMKLPTEHLGFAFDLGPGWLELGECSRTCAP